MRNRDLRMGRKWDVKKEKTSQIPLFIRPIAGSVQELEVLPSWSLVYSRNLSVVWSTECLGSPLVLCSHAVSHVSSGRVSVGMLDQALYTERSNEKSLYSGESGASFKLL